MTRIKICGLRDTDSALTAAVSGADYLGLVFAASRRLVTLDEAFSVIETVRCQPHPPLFAGVFAGMPAAVVNDIAHRVRLDRVQLSGGEPYAYCQEIEFPLIRVIHVRENDRAAAIIDEIGRDGRLPAGREVTFILDTQNDRSFGGTGTAFNWNIAREVAARFPVFIAGGLTPENVGELIKEVHPCGVDVSSGVESAGVKDPEKIRAFIRAVRSADRGGDCKAGGRK